MTSSVVRLPHEVPEGARVSDQKSHPHSSTSPQPSRIQVQCRLWGDGQWLPGVVKVPSHVDCAALNGCSHLTRFRVYIILF